jgi:hypothetical protein
LATLTTNQLGASAATVLLNQGTIQFDPAAANAILSIAAAGGGQFQNAGVVSVGGTNTINLTAPFGNTGTLAVSGGTLNLGGNFTRANLGSLNHTAGTVNITGNMDNSAAGGFNLTDTGPNPTGSITLFNGGTITGGTITAAGTAKIQANGNTNALVGVTLPASALDLSPASSLVQLRGGTTLTAGALSLGNGSALYINQRATTQAGLSFTLGRSAFLTAEGGNTVTLSANPGTPTVTVNPGSNSTANLATNQLGANAATTLVNQGTIQFDPSITNATLNIQSSSTSPGTFRNQGVLAVTGAGNSLSVTSPFVNAGTLLVGQTAAEANRMTGNETIASGGTLKGTGTVAGAVTVNAGGILSPGASPGTLTITGAVTMSTSASYSVELNGAAAGVSYDQLNLGGGGSINLNNSTLVTSLGYAPAPADSFTIITGGPVTGTFSGLPDGSTVLLGNFGGTDYTRTIQYGPTSVVLSPVPEPGHILLLASAAAFAWRRRRLLVVTRRSS